MNAASPPAGSPGHQPWTARAEPTARRVRALVDGRVLVDSRAALLVYEPGGPPGYYFPAADVDHTLLRPAGEDLGNARTGVRRSWHLETERRVVKEAAWSYLDPPAGAAAVAGLIQLAWDGVDAWFEEDEQVHHHPQDPYHRVDALRSSRHVQVHVDGVPVAESRRPVLVFETSMPVRYYLPATHVDLGLLRPSPTVTGCAYKGVARYWHAVVAGREHRDVAWSYPLTVPAQPAVAGLIAFDGPAVQVTVDGEVVPRAAAG